MHPMIPEHLRGTYAALCHGPVISHLKQLGVTSIELLPVHHHVCFAYLSFRNTMCLVCVYPFATAPLLLSFIELLPVHHHG